MNTTMTEVEIYKRFYLSVESALETYLDRKSSLPTSCAENTTEIPDRILREIQLNWRKKKDN